jgi:YVTN family beta-propeller protein
MILMTKRILIGATFLVTAVIARAQSAPPAFANFEPSPTNPIRLSADKTRLFAVNAANASLSVFDVTQPGSPKLLAEIPVGLGPVSVNPQTDDIAWVVNQVSNSISVVSAGVGGSWSKGFVTATIPLKVPLSGGMSAGEPMDVVFAGALAYVSISRAHQIGVIDTKTLTLANTIQLFGDSPRAMAVSPDGSTVYAALALAGNGSTLIPNTNAPPQCGSPGQPQCVPAMNPDLPPPPQVGLIVLASDTTWYPSFITFTMPANGVAAIKTGATPSVSYYSYVGTTNLGLAVNPATGDLFVANTDALNLTNFENNLCGHWVNNRITRIQVATGTVTPFDLNPKVAYGCAPNPADLKIALAQPAGVVFDPHGSFMYVAAFGTDRVAKVNTSGSVLGFVEVALASGQGSNVDPANKRGPRGLALNSTANTLYSLNTISNTISIIPTSLKAVASEIPVGTDPTPAAVKAGRGFLYDAKLSGTGTGACASCHIDSEMDHIAWNLGDPAADLTSFVQDGQTFLYHPMKGPMTTQTLRGLLNLAPYHWRGDKPDFAAFNGAFQALMGSTQISDSDMASFTTFMNSVLYLPNPNQTLARGLPTSLNGGNPQNGFTDFLTVPGTLPNSVTCQSCHQTNPGPGTNLLVRPAADTEAQQPMKIPQLRAIYQKDLFNRQAATTIDGFGLVHDGAKENINAFLQGTAFGGYTQTQKNDIAAYSLCFDTGTAPAVGYTRTLTAANVTTSPVQTDWTTLQSQAAAGNIDLIGRGTLGGVIHGLLYQPSSLNYVSDTGAVYPQSQLQTLILSGDTLSIMGVYPGTGSAKYQP